MLASAGGARTLVLAALLALATLVAYEPLRENGFVTFDDPVYVTANPHVQGGTAMQSAAWAFTTVHAANWHPLTWLSHRLDCAWWGLDPFGHHLTSLLLHVANAGLLFVLLARTTRALGRSLFVAAVFALHPLHVESVAWVAERKDVLSTFFGLLALHAWVSWTERAGTARYLGSLALYACALLSKPMLVSLPLLLLLLDVWPLRRPRRLREKLPFFALAFASCVVTILAQRAGGSMARLPEVSAATRFGNVWVSCASYVAQAVWPSGLCVFYPFPVGGIPLWIVGVSIAGVWIATSMTVRAVARRPELAVGWLWFLITLAPVIGLVQVGRQARADRYTYLPLVGLAIVVAWAVPGIVSRGARTALAAAAGAACLVGIVLTRAQVAVWKDDLALFGHACAVTRDNYLCEYNLAGALRRAGRQGEAIAHMREGLRVSPDHPDVQLDFATLLEEHGDLDEAIEHFRKALELAPDSAAARAGLDRALGLWPPRLERDRRD